MSSTVLALLLMQYVVSVKAGLVNHVQGPANVAEMEQVRQGKTIQTARDGYVEVLLTPGSFLRIGENSAVVLDGVELERVSLLVLQGPAVIEVIDINRKYPIKVTTGSLTTNIIASGIYKFEDGVATVLGGKLQTADTRLIYEKGWQVFIKDNYRARKVKKVQTTSLDVYSQERSQTIASANASLVASLSPSHALTDPYWLFDSSLGFYTFIPFAHCRSPYGHHYYTPGTRFVVPTRYSTSSDPGRTTSPSVDAGGNTSSGGGTPAPAPVVSTPSGERSAPAVYIESKGGAVGATQ
jgi:hypothetical protein